MSRRMLAIALLLAGAAAAAAEAAPASVVQSGRETQAEPKLTTVSERKSTQRKGGEAPKTPAAHRSRRCPCSIKRISGWAVPRAELVGVIAVAPAPTPAKFRPGQYLT